MFNVCSTKILYHLTTYLAILQRQFYNKENNFISQNLWEATNVYCLD